MSAAVEAAPAVEPASTVKSTSASNRRSAAEAVESALATERRRTVEFSGTAKTRAPNPPTSIEARPTTPVGMTVEAVEPGPGADKDAASKVVRPIVAIRGACVRIIAVVSVRAVRRWTHVNRSNSYPNRPDADRHLSTSRSDSRREYQQSQHESVL